jgi:phenylacetyl-CoA:acceptor oxidoreductase subunit 1
MTLQTNQKSNGTPRWGMVIDVNRCVGCQTCTIACKHANDTLPGVQWRRVVDVEMGEFPSVERFFLVTGCQHCAEPPCVPVCPTGATWQREDGLVIQDYDVCIGCAYCAVSCPYQARTIAHDQRWYYGRETKQEEAVKHEERLGVAQKCTFCKDRVDAGIEKGLTPGVDPEATPACAAACISSAIQFGDFNDPASNVSKLLAGPHFQLNAELGTDPQIKYLYTTPAIPGRPGGSAELDEERLSDPANPLVGPLQTLWDWRAAMNWIFGGIASGFAVMAYLASLAGAVYPDMIPSLHLIAGGIMAIGLFCVFLKIGRKLRFWRAVSRPQTSWMTRELYAVAVFYPLVLANLLRPSAILSLLGGALALVFLWCQAKILHRARGIPAWRVPLMPWMLLATGLLEGTGLLALLLAWMKGLGQPGLLVPVTGLALVAVNVALWVAYRRTAKEEGIVPLARRVIDDNSLTLHLVGHALPALMFLVALINPALAHVYLGIGGVGAIAGGAFWKFTLIVRAGYQQGFALPAVPQRGSGSRAAPVRAAGTKLRAAPTRMKAAAE